MPAKPRMLIIAERFPPDLGGVAGSAERTARAISRLGVECHALAWTKLLPPGRLETTELTAESSAQTAVIVHRLGLFANLDFSLQHTMNVIEWLHEEHPFDAIWGHYLFPAGFMAVMIAESLSIASTVSARGNDIDRIMFPPGDFSRLSWTLDRADVISAVSGDLARKIAVVLGRDPDVQVVHNSVDVETFSPGPTDTELRQTLGIAPHEAVLGFCGELRHKKGLPFLLEALAEVRRRRPACLLVIGEVRAREQALLSSYLAEDSTRGERLIITGQIEDQRDVVRDLRLCDVFLHPSVWDGLPNALLEAMACGRLVIASDAGGIPEAIEHEVSGFVIPRAHLHRLGEAVLDALCLSDEQRNRIGLAARRRVVERFQDQHEAAGLRKILSRLDARRRGHTEDPHAGTH